MMMRETGGTSSSRKGVESNAMYGEAERVAKQRGWAQIIVSEANEIKIKKSEI